MHTAELDSAEWCKPAREIGVPTSSSSAFPRALKKIVFPLARVPKTPGTRERRNANPGTRAQLCILKLIYTVFNTLKHMEGGKES